MSQRWAQQWLKPEAASSSKAGSKKTIPLEVGLGLLLVIVLLLGCHYFHAIVFCYVSSKRDWHWCSLCFFGCLYFIWWVVHLVVANLKSCSCLLGLIFVYCPCFLFVVWSERITRRKYKSRTVSRKHKAFVKMRCAKRRMVGREIASLEHYFMWRLGTVLPVALSKQTIKKQEKWSCNDRQQSARKPKFPSAQQSWAA